MLHFELDSATDSVTDSDSNGLEAATFKLCHNGRDGLANNPFYNLI